MRPPLHADPGAGVVAVLFVLLDELAQADGEVPSNVYDQQLTLFSAGIP